VSGEVNGAEAGVVLYLDADGCPVKEESYKVARRHGLLVYVVSNRPIRVPFEPLIRATVVGNRFDAADDWIAERVGEDDIVVTSDLPLAGRAIAKGAIALTPKGVVHDEASIGSALAMRELLDQLRQMGEQTGGPAPMGPRDRSRYLDVLEQCVRLAVKNRSDGE